MAFTTQEEADIRAAFYGPGGQINDLPIAEDLEGAHVEVQAKSGGSFRVNLMGAFGAFNGSIAGRVWSESQATPIGKPYGNIDMLRNLPALLGIGCYLVADDRTRRKLDGTNHYYYADGSPAKLDGSEGQYMWCWNGHWYAYRVDVAGNHYEIVSFTKPGPEWESYYIPEGGTSAIGGGVVDRQAVARGGGSNDPRLCSLISDDARYRGGNNEDAYDGAHNSFLGTVASNINGSTFSRYARDRGEGWEAGWYVARAVQEYLFRIIMGTRNSQAPFNPNKDANGLYQGGLGAGVTGISTTQWENHNHSRPFIKTSVGVELGDGLGVVPFEVKSSSGQVIYTAPVPVFFGLKNPYGYLYRFNAGIKVYTSPEKTIAYVAPSMYGYNRQAYGDAEGMVKAAELPGQYGYIKRLSMHLLCGLPTELGASDATFYCDHFWSRAPTEEWGWWSRMSGGLADASVSAGMHSAYARGGTDYGQNYVTSPLVYFVEDPVTAAV